MEVRIRQLALALAGLLAAGPGQATGDVPAPAASASDTARCAGGACEDGHQLLFRIRSRGELDARHKYS